VFAKHRVIKLAFDRWNFKHLKPWLLAAGFSETMIAEQFVEFGQGTQSRSPALRALEEMILGRKLRHGGHPVLTMCAANAVVEGSDASNRKLSKKRSSGRIDGMVALAMAVGVAPLSPVRFDPAALIG
jgi:phage terminase large subunit-like protein